jgi:hypothetical protein
MKKMLVLLAMMLISSCTIHKNVCDSFIVPKIDLLAETISMQCECPPENIMNMLRPVTKTICSTMSSEIEQSLESQDKAAGPITSMACVMVTNAILNYTGTKLSENLGCVIPMDRCMPGVFLKELIENKVCLFL